MVVPNIVDIQQMPLYDTLTIAANTATPTQQYMFTEPISATKGRSKTNLTQAGRLEAPKSFLIKAVRVVLGPTMLLADASNLLQNYILRLIVGDKDYQCAGLDFFPAGGGLVSAVGYDGAASATEKTYVSNGIQDPRAINALDHPITISQGENFRVELEGTTFTTVSTGPGVWLRVYLDGVLGRQVQ